MVKFIGGNGWKLLNIRQACFFFQHFNTQLGMARNTFAQIIKQILNSFSNDKNYQDQIFSYLPQLSASTDYNFYVIFYLIQ